MTNLYPLRPKFQTALLSVLFLLGARITNAQTISTFAGNGIRGYSGDGGIATSASLNSPMDVYVDIHGNLYIAEYAGNRIRKVNATTGIITTIAGNGVSGFTGDGDLANNASLRNPMGVSVDVNGNVYIADVNNDRVRKVDANSGIIRTLAGNGTKGYSGDGGLAINAAFGSVMDVCIDDNNNLYIADAGNARIRQVNVTTGIITTIAGNGISGFSGDGGLAINASIDNPHSIYIDKNANLYISDYTGARIRKVDMMTGIITTIAGDGTYAYSGDGGPAINARIYGPTGASADGSGNVYIAEYAGSRIRKISGTTGIITTLTGTGINGFNGDGRDAITAQLNSPHGVCIDKDGNIYIADPGNHRIRKITPSSCTPTITINTSANNICGDIPVTFTASVTNEGTTPVYQWRKNGINVGTNSPTYTIPSRTLNNGDILDCILTSSAACATSTTVSSNPIIMNLIPRQPVPEVTVTADKTEICAGSDMTFTATNKSGNYQPSYQWLINGVNTGTNSATFTTAGLTNGDVVQCKMTIPYCGGVNGSTKVFSNPITISVNPVYTPSITIFSNTSTICQGEAVTFTASSINGGNNPIYEWQVNGVIVSDNSITYTSSTLNNGDRVSCKMYTDPSLACLTSTSVIANIVVMNVNSNVAASIQITSSANNICFGQPVTFTATPTHGGTSPVFQWKVNGSRVGTNSATYTSGTLNNGDIVSCELTSNAPCAASPTVNSNPITMAVIHEVTPEVIISADALSVCAGSTVTFSATNQSNSPSPSYQWQVNSTNVGTNSPTFAAVGLSTNATVQCIMTVPHCTSGTTKDYSEPITITVNPLPIIRFDPPTLLVDAGQQITLQPILSGTIASYEWTPSHALINPSIATPVTTPLIHSINYKLKVTSTDGCEAQKDIAVNVFKKLLMPNTFSPNGDGVNDVFRIPLGTTLTLQEFSVFDRWGNKVFTTTDLAKGWDGTSKGKAAPVGNYVYLINGTSPRGNISANGTIMLMR